MRCPNCNNEVPEGKRFCGQCGSPLTPAGPTTSEFENAPTRIAPPEPAIPPAGPAVKRETPPPPPEPQPQPPPQPQAAPAVETPTPGQKTKRPQPPAATDKTWLFAWLSILGWALGFALLSPIDTRFRVATYESGAGLAPFAMAAIVWSIAGVLGGLLTGIGLRRAVPGVKRWHVLLITLGWVASMVLSWPTGRNGSMELPYWVMCGSLLGVVAGLVSLQRGTSPWWKQVLKVLGFAVGTGVAWVLIEAILDETLWGFILYNRIIPPSYYIIEPVSLVLGGGTGGLLTGLVWQRAEPSARGRQVLIITVGWAIGWLLGMVVVLANLLTLAQMYRPNIDYTLVGVIGGAISSGVMAWQLRRPNRKP
jgi:hypothetical protein